MLGILRRSCSVYLRNRVWIFLGGGSQIVSIRAVRLRRAVVGFRMGRLLRAMVNI